MARRILHAAFAAVVLAAWSMAERELASGGHPHAAPAAVALWATAWYVGYSVGLRLSPTARGRRILAASTAALALSALALPWTGPWVLAAYLLLSTASALAVSAVVSTAVQEGYDDWWRDNIAWVKGATGVLHAVVLLAAYYVGLGAAPLLAAGAGLALVSAALYWDPIIRPTTMRVLDRFATAAAMLGAWQPRPRGVASLAALAGALTASKIVVLPAATAEAGTLALAVHAAGLALGASMAARHSYPTPVPAGLLGLAGLIGGALVGPAATLLLYSTALGYADAALLIAALEERPSGAAAYSGLALLFMLAAAAAIAAGAAVGVSVEAVAGAAAAAALLVYRPRRSWA